MGAFEETLVLFMIFYPCFMSDSFMNED